MKSYILAQFRNFYIQIRISMAESIHFNIFNIIYLGKSM